MPPLGFVKVSLEQLQRADLALFKELMRMTRSGMKASGAFPLEEALEKAMELAEISLNQTAAQVYMPSPAMLPTCQARNVGEQLPVLVSLLHDNNHLAFRR